MHPWAGGSADGCSWLWGPGALTPCLVTLSPKPPASRARAGSSFLLLQVEGMELGTCGSAGTALGTTRGMSGSAGVTPAMPMAGKTPGTPRQAGGVAVCLGAAGGRGSEEELLVAGLAVHLVALLAEGAFLQLAQAVGADEVLGVVLAPRGRDAAAGHRAAAAVADVALSLVEVQLAVGPTLELEEGAAGEAAQALLGEEEMEAAGPASGTRWPLRPRQPAARLPRTRSTRGARRPAGLTGSRQSRGVHSPGISGQTWPRSPGGSRASRRARGNLRGGRQDGHPPGGRLGGGGRRGVPWRCPDRGRGKDRGVMSDGARGLWGGAGLGVTGAGPPRLSPGTYRHLQTPCRSGRRRSARGARSGPGP